MPWQVDCQDLALVTWDGISQDDGMGVVSWNAIGSPVSVPDGTQIMQICFKDYR